MKPTKENYFYLLKNSYIGYVLGVVTILLISAIWFDYWIIGWVFAILIYTNQDVLGWRFTVQETGMEDAYILVRGLAPASDFVGNEQRKNGMASYRVQQHTFMVIILILTFCIWGWKPVVCFIFSWQFLLCEHLYYFIGKEKLNKDIKITWFGWSLPAYVCRKIFIDKTVEPMNVVYYNTLAQFLVISVVGILIPTTWFILEKVL